MFNTDKPITKMEEDLLGRESFVELYANAIYNFNSKDNLVISLQGEWGSGKTSLLNLIKEKIVSLNEEKGQKIIIVDFKPWNYTENNQLLHQFFTSLADKLSHEDSSENLKKASKDIIDFLEAIGQFEEEIKKMPFIGKWLGAIIRSFKKILGKVNQGENDKLNNLDKRRLSAEKSLAILDEKILFIIDDIDRLSNEQIKLIFQLVNSIAGFSNITYLLSFDRKIVSNALSAVQNCDGEKFLEKIIQVPLDLPKIQEEYLNMEIYRNFVKLSEIGCFGVEELMESELYLSCIKPYLSNLRDIKRYFSTLSFYYQAAKDEVYYVDYFVMIAFMIFDINIYNFIYSNKHFLLTGSFGEFFIGENDKDIFKELCNTTNKNNPNALDKVLSGLFPFAFDYRSRNFPDYLERQSSINSPDRFDTYFTQSLNSNIIGKLEIKNIILEMDEYEIRKALERYCSSGIENLLVDVIKYSIDMIPENRIATLISGLFFKQGEIYNENIIKGRNINRWNGSLLYKFFEKISCDSTRFDYLKNIYNNSDFNAFNVAMELTYVILIVLKKVKGDYSKLKKIISEEQFEEIKGIILKKIDTYISDRYNLFENDRNTWILKIWMCLSFNNASEYIERELPIGNNIIYYIMDYIDIYTSINSSKASYKFRQSILEPIVSYDELKEQLITKIQTEEFWILSKDLIYKTVVFLEGNKNGFFSSEEIDSKIKELKKQYGFEHIQSAD